MDVLAMLDYAGHPDLFNSIRPFGTDFCGSEFMRTPVLIASIAVLALTMSLEPADAQTATEKQAEQKKAEEKKSVDKQTEGRADQSNKNSAAEEAKKLAEEAKKTADEAQKGHGGVSTSWL